MKKRPSSTEDSAPQALPNAFAIERLPLDQLLVYKRTLELSGETAEELQRSLAALHANRGELGRLLGALPPLCLVTLEVLAEVGGMLGASSLWHLVAERTGVAIAEVKGYARELMVYGLAVRVEMQNRYTSTECFALLVTPNTALPALVSGLTLPHRAPPPPERDARVSELERRTLALSTLTLHRRVRVNRDLSPNRSALKALVKELGVDAESAEELLMLAAGSGLVRPRLDAYTPVLPALRTAAAQGLRASPLEQRLCTWLPEREWVPLERFLRALLREQLGDALTGPAWATSVKHYAQLLGTTLGRDLVLTRFEGHTWVYRRAPTLPEGGDGYVTPNLDVYLGPAAHPDLIVSIGLCAELVRIDRLLSFRLTPASVTAGLSAGVGLDELIGALERVGPHGLPDVVRANVNDFSRRLAVARAQRGWVLRLPEHAATAFQAKHAKLVIERLGPDLLMLSQRVEAAQLAQWLKTLGVHAALAGEEEDEDERDGYADGFADLSALTARPELPLAVRPLHEPDAELRAAVEADRKAGYEPSRRRRSELTRPAHGARTPEEIARSVEAVVDRLGQRAQRVVAGSKRLAQLASAELEAWSKTLSPAHRAALERLLLVPVLMLPYLALKPEWRAKARKRAASPDSLGDVALELCTSSRASPEGYRLLLEMRLPDVQDAVAELVAELPALIDGPSEAEGPSPTAGDADAIAAAVVADVENDLNEESFDDDFDDEDLDDEELGDDDFDGNSAGLEAPRSSDVRSPAPSAFPPLTRDGVRDHIAAAVRDSATIHVRTSSRTGAQVQTLRPEAIQRRGGATLLLGNDVETNEGRALDLSSIDSVLQAEADVSG